MAKQQAYYWTPEWQADERESLDELAAGNGRTFDSAEDVIAWLQADEAPPAAGQQGDVNGGT